MMNLFRACSDFDNRKEHYSNELTLGISEIVDNLDCFSCTFLSLKDRGEFDPDQPIIVLEEFLNLLSSEILFEYYYSYYEFDNKKDPFKSYTNSIFQFLKPNEINEEFMNFAKLNSL